MKPVRLHVFPASPNARKVTLLNAYLGLGLETVIVDLTKGEQKAPEFLALNPNGKMPVLEFDDGTSLWESNAILNWLASYAESDLWPKSQARYDIMRWQFWEACHWTPAASKFISRHLFGNESIDMEEAETDFARFAGVLDGHLAGRDWLVGDAMSTADLSIAPILYLRAPCQMPLQDYAHISRWIARIEALPAWEGSAPEALAA